MEDSLADLSADLARDGETVLDALDRLAPKYLGGGRPDLLLRPHIDEILRTSLRGHPWSQLLAAAALWDIRRDDPAIPRLVESASRAFRKRRDLAGLGYVAHVRGNFALGRGRLEEAASWWERARQALGEEAPSSEMNLAYLALSTYQVGDLRAATKLAEEALALARLRGHRRAEGLALVFVAFFCLTSGAFSRAESALALAEQAWADLPSPEDAPDLPLLDGARGVLLALRGQEPEARRAFDRALEVAERIGNSWHGAIARAAGAETLAHIDSRRALTDSRKAKETFEELGDNWFWVWARRAEGVALRESGNPAASTQIFEALLSSDLDPIESARTKLAFGETLLVLSRRDDALIHLTEAADACGRLGMRYWQARCTALLATADPSRRALWLRRAQALKENDPAYASIVDRRSTLAVNVVGRADVIIDGAAVRFLTVHAKLLVLALAIAGASGLHAEDLIERLWPDVALHTGRHRLRTALWDARRALGSEAWRLIRERDRLLLDLSAADFDLARLRDDVKRWGSDSRSDDGNRVLASLATLEDEALLPPWRDLDWVQREQERIWGMMASLGAASQSMH